MIAQTPPPSTSRASAKTIAVVFACTTLFLVIAELTARALLGPNKMGNDFVLDSKTGWRYPSNLRQTGKEWFGVFHPELHFDTNNRGLKGTRNYPAPRANNEIRILCLGDSSTNYQHFDSYPELLQRRLSETFPEKKFWVQNAGVAGFSSYNVKNLAKIELPLFDPDFVIVLTGTCDASRAPVRDSQKKHIGTFSDLIALVAQESRLVGSIRGALPNWLVRSYTATTNRDKEGHDGVRVTPEEYRANLKDIAKRARKRGATALISTVTWLRPEQPPDAGGNGAWAPIRPYQEVVRNLKPGGHLIVVDPAKNLLQRKDRAAFFAWIPTPSGKPAPAIIDTGHLNIAGNELVAAFFAKALIPAIQKKLGETPYNPDVIKNVFTKYKSTPRFDSSYMKFIPPTDAWKAEMAEEKRIEKEAKSNP